MQVYEWHYKECATEEYLQSLNRDGWEVFAIPRVDWNYGIAEVFAVLRRPVKVEEPKLESEG